MLIETADGAVGSYVGGQANSMAQAAACARNISGMDGFARELAYKRIPSATAVRRRTRIAGCGS